MTQIDKLRANGITGKGAKIAVIDSGVSCPPLFSWLLNPDDILED
jgi:subtilisin family serine protease